MFLISRFNISVLCNIFCFNAFHHSALVKLVTFNKTIIDFSEEFNIYKKRLMMFIW
jgi:hypothetical protein